MRAIACALTERVDAVLIAGPISSITSASPTKRCAGPENSYAD